MGLTCALCVVCLLPSLVQPDPTLLCCAFQKQRLYLFTQREPAESEDMAAARWAHS